MKCRDNITHSHDKIKSIPVIITEINELNYYVQEGRISLTDESTDNLLSTRLRFIKDKLSPMIQNLPNMIDLIFEGEKVISLKVKHLNLSE